MNNQDAWITIGSTRGSVAGLIALVVAMSAANADLVVLIVVFLVIREFFAWYWKINEALGLMRGIRDELHVANTSLAGLQGLVVGLQQLVVAAPASQRSGPISRREPLLVPQLARTASVAIAEPPSRSTTLAAPLSVSALQPTGEIDTPGPKIRRADLTSDGRGICPYCGRANEALRTPCKACGATLEWRI